MNSPIKTRTDAPDDHREVRTRRVIQLAIHCLAGDIEKAEVIGKRFGVSMRTIYRDLRLLRDAGLKLEPKEDGGGYYFPRKYHLRCPQLEVSELAALRLLAKLVESELSPQHSSFLTRALDKVFLASISEFHEKAEQTTAECGRQIDSFEGLEAALEKMFTLLREAQ